MTSLAELPIRDDLRGKTPYGAPQKAVRIALNVNENTHPVPPDVIAHVAAAVERELHSVNRYPDREFTLLREHLAHYLSTSAHTTTSSHTTTGAHTSAEAASFAPDQIWAANGSNEVIQHVLQAFGGPGRRVLGFPPTYSMHSIIAAGTGTEWATGDRDADFRLSSETAVAAVKRTDPDVVFLCAPNNPTGTPLSIDTIAAVYEASRGIVMVDEAYAEFMPAGEPDALSLLPGRERLVVSRTMSKAFAFAGARLGYLAADPAVIDALRLVRLPYHLSGLTQAAAVAALEYAPTMLRTVDAIREQRDRLLVELPALGYSPHKSWANFVLFGGVDDPQAVFEYLLARDILIRDVGLANHLRVTAGTPDETTEFLDVLARMSQ